MKISVSGVPPEGMQAHEIYQPAGLDMDREDIHLKDPFEVDAAISCFSGELVVKAKIHAALHCLCARCLQEFRQPLETEALFSYEVRPGDVVDITEDVRQEIILAFPMRPLCRPDCQVRAEYR